MSPEKLRSLIRAGRNQDRQLKQLADDLKETKATLFAHLKPGKHEGTAGAVATIIHPAPTIQNVEDLAPARELLAKLPLLQHVAQDGHRTQGADELLARLFTTATVHKPVKGFREIVRTILPGNVADELIALVEKPSAPQCRFA